MTEPGSTSSSIAVVRAELYPHQDVWEALLPESEDEVENLKVDHLSVRRADVAGRVTIAGCGDPTDCHGVEFDLEAEAARELGRQLTRVADSVEAAN